MEKAVKRQLHLVLYVSIQISIIYENHMKNLRFVYFNSTGIVMMAIILLLPLFSLAIQSYTSGQQLNVLATSGMNLRDASKGTVLQKIPYGARIKTLQAKSTTNPETIEGIQGNWVKVEYNGATGFVFDGFLSTLPAPELSENDLRNYLITKTHPLSGLVRAYSYLTAEGRESNAVALYTLGNDTLVYNELNQVERFITESLTIPGATAEEAYLLIRALHHEKYMLATSAIAENVENESTASNALALKGFVLNGISTLMNEDGEEYEVNNYYTCDLVDYCVYRVTIHELDGSAFITLFYGC
jgi:hypothetical protein